MSTQALSFHKSNGSSTVYGISGALFSSSSFCGGEFFLHSLYSLAYRFVFGTPSPLAMNTSSFINHSSSQVLRDPLSFLRSDITDTSAVTARGAGSIGDASVSATIAGAGQRLVMKVGHRFLHRGPTYISNLPPPLLTSSSLCMIQVK